MSLLPCVEPLHAKLLEHPHRWATLWARSGPHVVATTVNLKSKSTPTVPAILGIIFKANTVTTTNWKFLPSPSKPSSGAGVRTAGGGIDLVKILMKTTDLQLLAVTVVNRWGSP